MTINARSKRDQHLMAYDSILTYLSEWSILIWVCIESYRLSRWSMREIRRPISSVTFFSMCLRWLWRSDRCSRSEMFDSPDWSEVSPDSYDTYTGVLNKINEKAQQPTYLWLCSISWVHENIVISACLCVQLWGKRLVHLRTTATGRSLAWLSNSGRTDNIQTPEKSVLNIISMKVW